VSFEPLAHEPMSAKRTPTGNGPGYRVYYIWYTVYVCAARNELMTMPGTKISKW